MSGLWRGTASENGGSDPDQRCIFGNGLLKIRRHAHRQYRQPVTLAHLAQETEMRGGVLAFGRDAHQATDFRTEPFERGFDESISFFARNAGFLGLVAGIDLHEKLGKTPGFLRAFLNGVGQGGAVEALDHVGDLAGFGRLVGLKSADDMQTQVGPALPELRKLGSRFLHTVLAEQALAGVQGGFHALDRMELADGDEGDIRLCASGLFAGLGDAVTDSSEVPADKVLGNKIGHVWRRRHCVRGRKMRFRQDARDR